MIVVGETSFGHTVIPENKLHPLLPRTLAEVDAMGLTFRISAPT